MTNISSVSVIIAAYNEERTLSSILEIVRSWGKATEIIVIDDGSKDKTVKSIKQFLPDIKLIIHRKNMGKAAAIADGIQKSTGDILLLLDADCVGLTHRDLDLMSNPVLRGKADMVLGLARFWSAGPIQPFNKITGQRVLLSRYIKPNATEIGKLGYGLELYINNLYKSKRVVKVKLPHVFFLGKFEKTSKQRALLSYARELKDLVTQLANQYKGGVSPRAKLIFNKISDIVSDISELVVS